MLTLLKIYAVIKLMEFVLGFAFAVAFIGTIGIIIAVKVVKSRKRY